MKRSQEDINLLYDTMDQADQSEHGIAVKCSNANGLMTALRPLVKLARYKHLLLRKTKETEVWILKRPT